MSLQAVNVILWAFFPPEASWKEAGRPTPAILIPCFEEAVGMEKP